MKTVMKWMARLAVLKVIFRVARTLFSKRDNKKPAR
jgi:hypothetical protein